MSIFLGHHPLLHDGENITLKTLFDIVERGLGGKLNIEVQL